MIETLPVPSNKVIRIAIRNFCKKPKSIDGLNLYQLMHQDGMGLDETEEAVIKLIEQGLLAFDYEKMVVWFPQDRRSNVDRRRN